MTLVKKTKTLRQKISILYCVALFIIACVMITAYATINAQINLNKEDGHIINISGQQRMLSQRIALLSEQLVDAESVNERAEHASNLLKSIFTMRQNHEELIARLLAKIGDEPYSDRIYKYYYGDERLDKRVLDYLAQAEALISFYFLDKNTHKDEIAITDSIVKTALGGLLVSLNDVVYQYEKEASLKVENFRKLETFFLFIGLMTLIIEALLIFKPILNEIVKKTDDLERSNAELTEFSYRISHDLRAPVVSSSSLSDVAKESIRDGDTKSAFTALNHIKSAMTKLENLIEDIIGLTKVKLVDMEEEEVSLGGMVFGIIQELNNLEGAENIEITTDIKIENPIFVKRIFLQQSLENLISNAIKYHNPAEENPKIHISAHKDKKECVISIRDNGLGIAEEYRDRMFQMFQRFHPQVSFGSGLGLYLILANVHALDGEITYTPLENGSEFIIKFPLS